jgi:tetratricopeptide (TPR) repeat protein
MYLMEPGARIKCYRNYLGISQNELAGDCFTIPLIHLIETNKRGLTVSTATIIVDRLNKIAEEKGIKVTFHLSDLLMPYDEYAKNFCLKELADMADENFNPEKYLTLMEIAKYYSLHEVLIRIYDKLINHYYENRNYDTAVKYLQEQYELSLSKSDYIFQANILCKIGTCYYLLGKFDNSITAYNHGFELYKTKDVKDNNLLSKLLYNLTLCNGRLKRFEEALVFIDSLLSLQLREDLTNAMVLKAGILIELKKYEESISIYETLIGNDYDNIYIIQNNMAYALKCLGRLNDSIQYFTDSINNQIKAPSPDTTLSLTGIASAYRDAGNYKTSIKFYEYAVKNALDFNQHETVIKCCEIMFDMYKDQSKLNKFASYYYNLLEFCKNRPDNNAAF